MPVIRLPNNLYSRLEAHAKGFDSPARVIERILDNYEGTVTKIEPTPLKTNTAPKPELEFHPNEESFRQMLIKTKTAMRVIHYSDGSIESKEWRANSFTTSSNLRANIWSGPLRDWQQREIVRAEFLIED